MKKNKNHAGLEQHEWIIFVNYPFNGIVAAYHTDDF